MTEDLIDAIKNLAWSLVVADHLGDVWDAVFDVVRAAGLPEPMQESDGIWVMPWPIDPNHPGDEVERYAQIIKEVP